MTPRSAKQATRGDALAIARQLEQDCRALAACLGEIEAASAEQLEDACVRCLRQAQPLRARISAAAGELGRAGAASSLSPAVRRDLDAMTGEARRLLTDAASGCSSAARRVTESLAELERQLHELHRGGRILRSYAQAVRSR
jgi:hypothetical protein